MAFPVETSLTYRRTGKRALMALFAAGVSASVLMTSGCLMSGSISDSVSSPFKWSSDSSQSSSDEKDEAYNGDVRDYTETYVRSSSDVEAFKKGLSSLAARHGISNWEADQATYTGIGEGLGKARVKDVRYETFKTNLSGGDVVKATAIQRGYDKIS